MVGIVCGRKHDRCHEGNRTGEAQARHLKGTSQMTAVCYHSGQKVEIQKNLRQ